MVLLPYAALLRAAEADRGRGTEQPRRDWAGEYIPDEEIALVWGTIQHAIVTRSTFELEHRVRRLDASIGWVFSRAIPLFDQQGNIAKWFGAASDITERKRTEQALRLAVSNRV